MGFGLRLAEDTGVLSEWSAEGGRIKLKKIVSFKKANIPSFHYSIIFTP
jgi:hypothetical protein